MRGSGGEALAVGGGAEPVVGLEAAGEAALVGPADCAPDAGDRLIGVQEQDGRVLGAELAVARKRDVSTYRVLLAWLLQQAPNIVPLAGASRPASIRDSAARLDLTIQDLEDLRTSK